MAFKTAIIKTISGTYLLFIPIMLYGQIGYINYSDTLRSFSADTMLLNENMDSVIVQYDSAGILKIIYTSGEYDTPAIGWYNESNATWEYWPIFSTYDRESIAYSISDVSVVPYPLQNRNLTLLRWSAEHTSPDGRGTIFQSGVQLWDFSEKLCLFSFITYNSSNYYARDSTGQYADYATQCEVLWRIKGDQLLIDNNLCFDGPLPGVYTLSGNVFRRNLKSKKLIVKNHCKNTKTIKGHSVEYNLEEIPTMTGVTDNGFLSITSIKRGVNLYSVILNTSNQIDHKYDTINRLAILQLNINYASITFHKDVTKGLQDVPFIYWLKNSETFILIPGLQNNDFAASTFLAINTRGEWSKYELIAGSDHWFSTVSEFDVFQSDGKKCNKYQIQFEDVSKP